MGDALLPNLFIRFIGGQDITGNVPRLLGDVCEIERGAIDFAPGLGQWFSLFGNYCSGEAFAVLGRLVVPA